MKDRRSVKKLYMGFPGGYLEDGLKVGGETVYLSLIHI